MMNTGLCWDARFDRCVSCVRHAFHALGMQVVVFTKTSKQRMSWWICLQRNHRYLHCIHLHPSGFHVNLTLRLTGPTYSLTHLKHLHAPTSFLELRKGRSNRKERLMDGGDVQSPASVKLIDFDTVPWQH